MIALSGNVSLEFLTAFRSVDRSPIISHHLWIGMHGRERFAMTIVPSVKSKALCFNHAMLLYSPRRWGCRNRVQISALAHWPDSNLRRCPRSSPFKSIADCNRALIRSPLLRGCVPASRQPHRELGELADLAIHRDRAAVLQGYDFVTY